MQVPLRIVHLRDGLPPLEQAKERLLGDVLGFRATSGDHAHDTEETVFLRVEEVFERGWPRLLLHHGSIPPLLDARHLTHHVDQTREAPGTCSRPPCRLTLHGDRARVGRAERHPLGELSLGPEILPVPPGSSPGHLPASHLHRRRARGGYDRFRSVDVHADQGSTLAAGVDGHVAVRSGTPVPRTSAARSGRASTHTRRTPSRRSGRKRRRSSSRESRRRSWSRIST